MNSRIELVNEREVRIRRRHRRKFSKLQLGNGYLTLMNMDEFNELLTSSEWDAEGQAALNPEPAK